MPTEKLAPVAVSEARSLFHDLETSPALVLAVSGGPDSVALMVLAARWRDALTKPPRLVAVTVDHGLRKEAKGEAAAVAKLARRLKIAHRTVRWTGRKPKTGLPQAARKARYRLLADEACKARASHILTAHTLDDQAETVLIRMSRGSGMTGLGAMQRMSGIPGREPTGGRGAAAPRNGGCFLVRPLLDIPKSRLIATLEAAKIPYANDPTNYDPRFTRARLRAVTPILAQEGLDASRLALLARRLKRADLAIEAAVESALAECHVGAPKPGTIAFDSLAYFRLPAEIALRLLGRAITQTGDEGPVELAKLEALKEALDAADGAHFRRSLAGALVTLGARKITVERAPPRRGRALTNPGPGKAKGPKRR